MVPENSAAGQFEHVCFEECTGEKQEEEQEQAGGPPAAAGDSPALDEVAGGMMPPAAAQEDDPPATLRPDSSAVSGAAAAAVDQPADAAPPLGILPDMEGGATPVLPECAAPPVPCPGLLLDASGHSPFRHARVGLRAGGADPAVDHAPDPADVRTEDAAVAVGLEQQVEALCQARVVATPGAAAVIQASSPCCGREAAWQASPIDAAAADHPALPSAGR